jgi:hypothetical protein
MAENFLKIRNGIALGNLASAPSLPTNGDMYYDATANKFKFYENGAWVEMGSGGGGSGTVTSVALSLPSIFSVSGSPVTTSGTLTATLASQSANRVFASPDGSSGTPTFRSLVSADIPSLDAAKITTGTIASARLGTGTADSTTFLRGDGTWAAPTTQFSFNLANNQSSASDVTGMVFNGASIRSLEISYSIYRNTSSSELMERGTLLLAYKPVADTWSIVNTFAFDDAGITFTITNAGQVQYTSSNMSGTGYVGNVKYKIVSSETA